MKTTNHFRNTIKAYLDQRAETDVLFSFQYSKPEKNIDDCINYILNTVYESGENGFTDDEIYSMAIHYYDKDNIKLGEKIDAHVVVNHRVQLTEEEKEQARKDAIRKLQEQEYNRMKQPVKKAKRVELKPQQPTLFDF
ncbi:PcfK-like protein [Porphyromonadaceae bacterium KH3CP3RA]|nr:PcfK-like protein [Porphyromonadaceae bacterium KH3CP3RA]